MSRPKLPSELHPEYPKPTYTKQPWGLLCVKMPTAYEVADFYKAHPEFDNEGYYELQCPFCGDPVEEEGVGASCCGEYGHGEWILILDVD